MKRDDILKREVPIFTDYNMIKKLMFMPLFTLLCGFPLFLIISTKSKDIGAICFFMLIELIYLPLTIIIYTDHVGVYSDRIETGNVFSKKTTLFEAIKKLDYCRNNPVVYYDPSGFESASKGRQFQLENELPEGGAAGDSSSIMLKGAAEPGSRAYAKSKPMSPSNYPNPDPDFTART
ncbi:hypothetical protein [Clostridium beijerinckii]|uniref:hypothetical protein n=1 Tax=Clostridium beijerinckii TaxID=1520 RepID=UPI001A9BF372|nr:hypothetical protein [Clostridium beijerinckii]NRT73820.1 hypothetical protein [Clostridium beijerinckii]